MTFRSSRKTAWDDVCDALARVGDLPKHMQSAVFGPRPEPEGTCCGHDDDDRKHWAIAGPFCRGVGHLMNLDEVRNYLSSVGWRYQSRQYGYERVPPMYLWTKDHIVCVVQCHQGTSLAVLPTCPGPARGNYDGGGVREVSWMHPDGR